MKKAYLFFACTFVCLAVNATNYYVDAVNGNNSYPGTSPAQAFRAIQVAANLTNPGDTVFIMNGTYTSSGGILNITRSGATGAQIVYTNYPGHLPKLQATATTFAVVNIYPGISYITVNGLEISGYGVSLSLASDTTPAKAQLGCTAVGTAANPQNPVAKYNGNGISANSRGIAVGSHHLVITNNIVHDNCAVGIGTLNCDYLTIDRNTSYNNSWYTIYGTSGISVGENYNFDGNTSTYKIIVSNNTCYGNRMYVPYYNDCKVSDGNGIIMDIAQVDANGYSIYTGKQLVVNNLCYNNGGSGIHALGNNNIDFINNTAYLNAASPENGGSSIYAGFKAANCNFYNNILVSRPGKTVNNCPSIATNMVFDYNIYYGGSTISYVGAHSLIQDPGFVNPSTDPMVADFHLKQGGFAVNNGDNTHTYPTDKDGTSRPVSSTVDIGAYESNYSGNLNNYSTTPTTLIMAGVNSNGAGNAIYYGPFWSQPRISYQTSRYAINYPRTLLANYSLPAACYLTNIQFKKVLGSTVPPNTTVRIYLRNEASDNFGPAAFYWSTILPGATNPATLVYGGDAANIIGSAAGWQTVNFQVPFNYTGGNLGVFIEYLQNGFVSGNPVDITWAYDNSSSNGTFYNTGLYPGQAYAVKWINPPPVGKVDTIPPKLDSLTTSSTSRPLIAISYVLASSILPVTIQQFGAVKKTDGVYINWVTVTETNNAGYDIQRSSDGTNFTSIGSVASKAPNGTSTSPSYYYFTDPKPLFGVGFYRLVQKDKDGKQTFSSIVSVPGTAMQLDLVAAYPNPVSTKLTALLNMGGKSEKATISIQDFSGRILNRFQQQLPTGYSNIEIDLTKYAKATYLLVIELGTGERLTHKFVKL